MVHEDAWDAEDGDGDSKPVPRMQAQVQVTRSVALNSLCGVTQAQVGDSDSGAASATDSTTDAGADAELGEKPIMTSTTTTLFITGDPKPVVTWRAWFRAVFFQ